MTTRTGFNKGDRVRIERDEQKYPSRGSWPRYRDRTGTVVVPNRYGEVGVTFTPNPLLDGWSNTGADSWFMPHELVRTKPRAAR